MSKLLDMGYSYEEVKKRSDDLRKTHKDKAKKKNKDKDKKGRDPEGYDKRRGDKDKSPDDFDDYMDSYNLRSEGAGSQRDPSRSRFSAKDVGIMFDAGTDRFGESKRDAARAVLDYAEDMEDRTRMGGGTRRALDNLRKYLKSDKNKIDKSKKESDKEREEEYDEAQERLNETDLTRPENHTPRLDKYNSDDPMMDAISGGDDLGQWYDQKFVPHLHAEADHGIKAISRNFGHFLDEFVYGPPELGGVQPVFDKYKDEIDEAIDEAKKKK